MTRTALIVAALSSFLSCADPVLSDQVAAQGPETAGVPVGELHRAGQPCLTCHQEGGPASSFPFTLAGTVFAQPLRQIGVEGAEIRITDAGGKQFIKKTNCVGNFFIKAGEFQPEFPLVVQVGKGATRAMRSVIGREGSCGGCHSIDLKLGDPFSQVGHIYLFGGDEPGTPLGAADCKADPKRAGSP